ncbi:MAG: hypothetical protein ABJD75_10240 [Parasphingorhabdus sp.]
MVSPEDSSSSLMFQTSAEPEPSADDIDSPKIASLLLKIWTIRAGSFKQVSDEITEIPWNILLDLTCSEEIGRTVVASDLAIAYNVPKSTMNRYVDYLHSIGLVRKTRDKANRVRVLLTLTDSAKTTMSGTLDRIGDELQI